MTETLRLDWEDLHIFLAVARYGSARRASEELGCHYTSVIRRISNLESKLEARLFDKSPKGYELTELGRDIVNHADNMESEALAISRKLQGADTHLKGELRIAMTTTIASYLLVDDLKNFSQAYPDVQLELITNTTFADLTRGEAHVTVRVSNNPGDQLKGRRYGSYYEAVYARPEYLEAHRPDEQNTSAKWLHWLKGDTFKKYIAHSDFPNIQNMQTIADEVVLLNAARTGMGIATLPCFYADPDPCLVRVGVSPPVPCLGIWLLAHPDLTQNARVRAFMDFIGKALEGKKALLEGEVPSNGILSAIE